MLRTQNIQVQYIFQVFHDGTLNDGRRSDFVFEMQPESAVRVKCDFLRPGLHSLEFTILRNFTMCLAYEPVTSELSVESVKPPERDEPFNLCFDVDKMSQSECAATYESVIFPFLCT